MQLTIWRNTQDVLGGVTAAAMATVAAATLLILPTPSPALSQDSTSLTFVKTQTTNKDDDKNGVLSFGDELHYTFEVTNNGSVVLSDVEVLDPLPGMDNPKCEPDDPATLAPGDSMTCTSKVDVDEHTLHLGEVVNTATASAIDPNGALIEVEATVSTAVPPDPEITVDKSSALTGDADVSGNVTAGDTLTYTFVVENHHDDKIKKNHLRDPLVDVWDKDFSAFTCDLDTLPLKLKLNATLTCTATYVVIVGDQIRVRELGHSHRSGASAAGPTGHVG